MTDLFRATRRTYSEQNGGPVLGIVASTARASLTNRHRQKKRDATKNQARPQPRELTLNQEPNVTTTPGIDSKPGT